jgi:hypothetical protein
MITNDSELEQTRQNLANVEAAIESLRRELLPGHERNFRLYAQPWLDFKEQFESEIDAYLTKQNPSPNGSSPRPEVADVKDLKLT